jgi:hypothetical protein
VQAAPAAPARSLADAFEQALPYIDAASALQKLRNNARLYATMLRTLKGKAMCGSLLAALGERDWENASAISNKLLGVSESLGLLEVRECVIRLSPLLRRKDVPHEATEPLRAAVAGTYSRLDELISALESGQEVSSGRG